MKSKKLVGTPNALKQVNLSMVRKAIMDAGTATRAEVALATKIGATTVRNLLTEMKSNNELVEIGFDASIGGRKATRYALNTSCFFGVALCVDEDTVHYMIVDICGEACEKGQFNSADNLSEAICSFLDTLSKKMQIRCVGVGVPGVVSKLGYERKNHDGNFEYFALGKIIQSRFDIPVILENDLNATTLGFGRCCLKAFPQARCADINIAYLNFDNGCLSAGFLSEGRILRGYNNFAGELGLFPTADNQTLDDILAQPLSNAEYSSFVVKIVSMLCCVLNPQCVALGGNGFRKDCLALISEQLYSNLPSKLSTEIIYAEDKWHDYFVGMSYLTSQHIFSDVKLVKE